ncbi:hypothetical protein X943_001968 [Babesia divergens]|uniref:Uncharacterized protein n=1 Tax=Babesia divergens TaxID=32595 RepID=A0AAD9LFN3_BABDI|nr:hypothetical protein X943_001968 [Babesia divergens]
MYRCETLLIFILIVMPYCNTWASGINQPADQEAECEAGNFQGGSPSSDLDEVTEGAPTRQLFLGALVTLASSIFSPIVHTVANAIGLGPRSEPPPLPTPVVVPLPPSIPLEPIEVTHERTHRYYDSESDSDHDSGDDSSSDDSRHKHRRRRRRRKHRKSRKSRRRDRETDSDEESQNEEDAENGTKDASAEESIADTEPEPTPPLTHIIPIKAIMMHNQRLVDNLKPYIPQPFHGKSSTLNHLMTL